MRCTILLKCKIFERIQVVYFNTNNSSVQTILIQFTQTKFISNKSNLIHVIFSGLLDFKFSANVLMQFFSFARFYKFFFVITIVYA